MLHQGISLRGYLCIHDIRLGLLRVLRSRLHRREGHDDLGPLEIGLIVWLILPLFGYKELPDALRSLGRSLASAGAG